MSPGTYCNGLAITGSTATTFSPGIYIINGGNFSIGGSGAMTGNGVMFFITGQYGQTANAVNITGSGNLNFSAATSGTYKGILMYQDRSVTYGLANSISGSGLGFTTGTFYFPTTELDYSGSGNQVYQSLIASTVKMTGSANFKNDTVGTYTGLAKSLAALIQ